jgi:AraC-like DNA-binding protein
VDDRGCVTRHYPDTQCAGVVAALSRRHMEPASALVTEDAINARSDIRAAKFDDPDVFSAALQKVDLDVTQTGKGKFRAFLANFATGLCDVQVGSINQRIIASGATDKERVACLVESRKGREWGCFGQNMGAASVAVCSGGHDLLIKAPPDTEWAFISVASDALAQYARKLYGRRLPLPSRGLTIITIEPRQVAAFDGLLTEYLTTTDTGRSSPIAYKSSVDRALLRWLVQMMLGDTFKVRRPAIASFRQVLRRVEDFLAVNLHSPIGLEQLCEAVGFRKEPLEEWFRAGLGISAIRYLEIRHLSRVHKALVLADPRTTRVTDIARAWGFSNLRSFNYKFTALFKKSPAQVLQQPSAMFPVQIGQN